MKLGEKVEGLRGKGEVRLFTAQEDFNWYNTTSTKFWLTMAGYYAIGFGTYWYCTKNGLVSMRLMSSMIMCAVPLSILFSRKGDDSAMGHLRQRSLEERLRFYPVARRALERAIRDIAEESEDNS